MKSSLSAALAIVADKKNFNLDPDEHDEQDRDFGPAGNLIPTAFVCGVVAGTKSAASMP